MKSRVIGILLSALFLSCAGDEESGTIHTGSVDATTVRISAQAAGVVTRMFVDEGSEVGEGDTLALIDTEKPDLLLRQNRAMLGELRHQHDAALAQKRSVSLQHENLRLKYTRVAALLESNAVTRQSVDDLKTQLDAAAEQLKAAESALAVIASKREQVETTLRLTEKQIGDATVTAPLAGTVLVRYAEEGELLGIGGPICEIVDLRKVWVKIYIDEENLHGIRIGQEVAIRVDGREDPVMGTLSWISDRSEFTPKTILTEETRTTLVYPAKVTVENPGGLFKIGMPVSVIIGAAR